MSVTESRGVTVNKQQAGKQIKNSVGKALRLLQVGDVSGQVSSFSFDPELVENEDEKSSGKREE